MMPSRLHVSPLCRLLLVAVLVLGGCASPPQPPAGAIEDPTVPPDAGLDADVQTDAGRADEGGEAPDVALPKPPPDPLVVNSLADLAHPPAGVVTLRSALAQAASGETIRFAPELDGGTIALSLIGEPRTRLKGEVMGMRMEESGPISYLEGYFERDYGASALYARKDVVIDASLLAAGITIRWTGGADRPARVLAVLGHLTMNNVTITGGYSINETLAVHAAGEQPYSLARGGGLAVWGVAQLTDCVLHDNHCVGDFSPSRDRGAYGGGLYADIVELENCVVSGNTVLGAGAAGGGVFSLGGAEADRTTSTINQSTISGNRISGIYAYGAGVYSDGGGIGKRKALALTNTTVARNLAQPPPAMPPFLLAMGYWRGGGVYMSNGYLTLRHCTVAENEVAGVPRIDAPGKPNLAGGIAATIGNAHAVERMVIGHSIVVGNVVHEQDLSGAITATYAHDLFTGSLMHFESRGYNRLGAIDFGQILVPVGQRPWKSLSRKHYPRQGDEDGVLLTDVLDIDSGIVFSDTLQSAGPDAGAPAVLYYAPQGNAIDVVPRSAYTVRAIYAELAIDPDATDTLLPILLGRIEAHYGLTDFAAQFTADFEAYLQREDAEPLAPGVPPYQDPQGNPILTLADTAWFGPPTTWPRHVHNYPYIAFWRQLEAALATQAISGWGAEGIGDERWATLFASGPLEENPGITMLRFATHHRVTPLAVDQRGVARPTQGWGAVGAIAGPY